MSGKLVRAESAINLMRSSLLLLDEHYSYGYGFVLDLQVAELDRTVFLHGNLGEEII